jgi:hypothetical protein
MHEECLRHWFNVRLPFGSNVPVSCVHCNQNLQSRAWVYDCDITRKVSKSERKELRAARNAAKAAREAAASAIAAPAAVEAEAAALEATAIPEATVVLDAAAAFVAASAAPAQVAVSPRVCKHTFDVRECCLCIARPGNTNILNANHLLTTG